MAKRLTAWHVVDFETLFEPEEAKRKGRSSPLSFAKLITPAVRTDEGLSHRRKVDCAKAAKNGYAVVGLYTELLCYSAAQNAAIRGWFVNGDYSPASVAVIAQRLGCGDISFVKNALRTLERVKLMERIAPPDFLAAVRADKPALNLPAAGRPFSGKPPESDRPLAGPPLGDVNRNRNRNSNVNGNGELEPEQETASAQGATEAPGGSETETVTVTENPDGSVDIELRDADGHADTEPTRSPTTTPLPTADMPTIADPSPGEIKAHESNPGGADFTARAGPDAEIVATAVCETIYPDRAAIAAAARHAAGLPGHSNTGPDEFRAREIGAFASVWEAVLSLDLNAESIRALHTLAMKQASKIQKKRFTPKRSRGAVWCFVMGRHMESRPDVDAVRWKQAMKGRTI